MLEERWVWFGGSLLHQGSDGPRSLKEKESLELKQIEDEATAQTDVVSEAGYLMMAFQFNWRGLSEE